MFFRNRGTVIGLAFAALAGPAALAIVPALADGALATPDAADLPDSPALADFLRIAEMRHPGLAAARHEWRAEAERPAAVGSLPDPRVTFGWSAEDVETRVGPQKSKVAVRQRLPWFGKLGRRQDVAERGADVAAARVDERRLRLRRDVGVAWYDLWWAGRALEITRENLSLLGNLERAARERYRVGRTEHADLIRLQIEVGKLEDLVRTREDALAPVRARLNALMNRSETAPVPLPTDRPGAGAAPDLSGDLRVSLAESSPAVRIRERQTSWADARLDAARRERWPDWTLGVDWVRTDDALDPSMEDSGKDPLILSLAIDLPVFRGKHDGPVREAQERRLAADRRRAEEENAATVRAEEILYHWRDADRRADLYGNLLLPKAQEALEATLTGYRTGKSSFLDLIDAQRTLLAMELERERAVADRGRNAAELEAVTGRPWILGGAS